MRDHICNWLPSSITRLVGSLKNSIAEHPGRVLSHAHLLRSAWGPAHEKQTEYLRVAIRALRRKLEAEPARPRLFVNEPAVGYRLKI